jgi:hypothetical protein
VIVYEVVVNPVLTIGVPVAGVSVTVYEVADVAALHCNVGVAVTQPPFAGLDSATAPTAHADLSDTARTITDAETP